MFRQRRLLFEAEAAAGAAKHGPAVRHGEPHLRDADGAGRAPGRVSGACGIGRGQFADGMELEGWTGENAGCGSGDLFDRDDYLRGVARFWDRGVQGDAEVAEVRLKAQGALSNQNPARV